MKDSNAVLADAAVLIKKYGHCQHTDARDRDGRPVLPHARAAQSRSVTGALVVAGKAASGTAFLHALHAFASAIGVEFQHPRDWKIEEIPLIARKMCEGVWAWEDLPERTLDQVLSAFKNAEKGA